MKIKKQHIREILTLLTIFALLTISVMTYIAIDRIEWTAEMFYNLGYVSLGLILFLWPLSLIIAYNRGWKARDSIKRIRMVDAMTYQKEPYGFRYIKK